MQGMLGNIFIQISRLKEVTSHTEVSDYRLKIELQQVKEDNRGLRERNYQLHDDNIKLKEEVDTLRKSLETLESNRKTYFDDRHGAKITEHYKSHGEGVKVTLVHNFFLHTQQGFPQFSPILDISVLYEGCKTTSWMTSGCRF